MKVLAVSELFSISLFAPTPPDTFTEFWTGSNGSSWDAQRWPETATDAAGTSIIDIQSNQGRMSAGGAVSAWARARAFVAVGNFNLTMKFTLGTTGEQYHTIYVRAGDWTSGSDPEPANSYAISIESFDGTDELRFYSIVNNTHGDSIDVDKAWGTSQWNLRIQCQGPSIKVKAWQGSEPSSWDIETTNSEHVFGDVRLSSINGDAITHRPVFWDDLIIGSEEPASIDVSADTFIIDQDIIVVSVTDGPGHPANAVGIYTQGVNDLDTAVTWKYLSSNTQTLPDTGAANGQVTFSTEGMTEGSYEAHLLDVPPAAEPLFEELWTGSNGAAWNDTRWPTIGTTSTSIVDIQSNQGRMLPQGAAYAIARAASATSLSDFDLMIKFTRETSGEQYHKVIVRHDGDFNDDDPVNGYMFSIDAWNATDRFFVFIPVINGVRGTAISVAKAWTQDQWIMRIQCEGTALRARAWAAAGTEPGTWDIDTTESDRASGVIGLVAVNGDATTARQVLWDDLVVTPLSVLPGADPLFEELWTGSNGAAWNGTRWPTIGTTDTSIVDIQSNQGRMVPQGGSYALARAASASGSLTNFDLTIKFTRATMGEQYHKVIVRHDGDFTDDDPVNGYMFSIDMWDASSGVFTFIPVTDGVRGTPINISKTWTLDPWIMRIQCQGNALSAKVWNSTGFEPGSWDIATSHSEHATGVIGLVSVNGATDTARQILWDDLVVNPI